MTNIFFLYSELLFTRHPLNPHAFFKEDDEKITLYDGDITNRLDYEAFKIQKQIDEYYYSHSKKENKHFMQNVLFEINRLSEKSREMLYKTKSSLISASSAENVLQTYHNILSIYKNLISLKQIIIESYNLPILQKEKQNEQIKEIEFTALSFYEINKWRQKFEENLKKGKTTFVIENTKFNIRKEDIERTLKVYKLENVITGGKDIIEERSKPFIQEHNEQFVKETAQPESKNEFIEFKGNLDLLALLVELLMDVELIEYKNAKRKVARVLSQCIKIDNKNFSHKSLYNRYADSNYNISNQTIAEMKGKLSLMLSGLRKK